MPIFVSATDQSILNILNGGKALELITLDFDQATVVIMSEFHRIIRARIIQETQLPADHFDLDLELIKDLPEGKVDISITVMALEGPEWYDKPGTSDMSPKVPPKNSKLIRVAQLMEQDVRVHIKKEYDVDLRIQTAIYLGNGAFYATPKPNEL